MNPDCNRVPAGDAVAVSYVIPFREMEVETPPPRPDKQAAVPDVGVSVATTCGCLWPL